MPEQDLAYLIALTRYPKFGPRRLQKLLAFFGSPQIAFEAETTALIAAGIPAKLAEGFVHLRQEIYPDQLLPQLERAKITPLAFTDDHYPELLSHIYDPPVILYVAGELPKIPGVGIVGSRRASVYGKSVAHDFATALAVAGQPVVSGLAYGIDEAAHQATVAAGGATIGVLACSHDEMPTRTRYLASKMIEHGGAIVSEFFPGTPAQAFHFPIRNRIISGMTHSLLVIEAGLPSGSLITAKSALEQGRDVYAVPGPITSPTSKGTNQLIKDGAHVANSTEDLIKALDLAHPPIAERRPAETEEEEAILEHLSKQPVHINELSRLIETSTHQLAATLTQLEIKGRTKQIGGMYYVLL
jgi:DNA processing protein